MMLEVFFVAVQWAGVIGGLAFLASKAIEAFVNPR
jgi:hypothetical protein